MSANERIGVRIFFDEVNVNWSPDFDVNALFLRQTVIHANHVLVARGHVFLNDVYDMLHMPRTKFGQKYGWSRPINSQLTGESAITYTMKGKDGKVILRLDGLTKIIDSLP